MTSADLSERLAQALHFVGYRGTKSAVAGLLPVVRDFAADELNEALAEIHYGPGGEGAIGKVDLSDVLDVLARRAAALEATP